MSILGLTAHFYSDEFGQKGINTSLLQKFLDMLYIFKNIKI